MTPDLVQRIRSGDVSAFEELFRQLHAPLCEVVDSYVRSQDIAEEIVQELFFVVWVKRERTERQVHSRVSVRRGAKPRPPPSASQIDRPPMVALGR